MQNKEQNIKRSLINLTYFPLAHSFTQPPLIRCSNSSHNPQPSSGTRGLGLWALSRNRLLIGSAKEKAPPSSLPIRSACARARTVVKLASSRVGLRVRRLWSLLSRWAEQGDVSGAEQVHLQPGER